MARGIFDKRYSNGGKKGPIILVGILEILLGIFGFKIGGSFQVYVIAVLFIIVGLFTLFKG